MAKPLSKAKRSQRRRKDRKVENEQSGQIIVKAETKTKTTADKPKTHKVSKLSQFKHLCQSRWQNLQTARAQHVHLHKSFRRSYREDYHRDFKAPGLLSHAMYAFKLIFKHWKTFLPLILIAVACYVLFVGLMSEEVYQEVEDLAEQSAAEADLGIELGNFAKAGLLLAATITTGGLDSGGGEAATVFGVLIFLVIWLTAVYLLRHFLAGRKPRLRDGLYNACAPLISTMLVLAVLFIQLIPAMLVVVTLDAANATNFLDTPFYALVYFIFAALMLLLSGYLLSSSLIALVAVTAPGIYPVKALLTASDLMAGRRIKFIIRVIYLIFVVAMIFIVVMMPIILLDLWLSSIWPFWAEIAFVPLVLLVVTCFIFVYVSAYLYLYYRWMLDYHEK